MDTGKVGKNSDKIEKLKKAILKKDKNAMLKNLTNDFENYVCDYYPVVQRIKEELASAGALKSIMAGAGLSVVGFFDSYKKAKKARGQLTTASNQVLIAKPIN